MIFNGLVIFFMICDRYKKKPSGKTHAVDNFCSHLSTPYQMFLLSAIYLTRFRDNVFCLRFSFCHTVDHSFLPLSTSVFLTFVCFGIYFPLILGFCSFFLRLFCVRNCSPRSLTFPASPENNLVVFKLMCIFMFMFSHTLQ